MQGARYVCAESLKKPTSDYGNCDTACEKVNFEPVGDVARRYQIGYAG
jgi:hypothetical protein